MRCARRSTSSIDACSAPNRSPLRWKMLRHRLIGAGHARRTPLALAARLGQPLERDDVALDRIVALLGRQMVPFPGDALQLVALGGILRRRRGGAALAGTHAIEFAHLGTSVAC